MDLFYIHSFMSGRASAGAGWGATGAGEAGTQAPRQDIAAHMSDSGSVFDDGMIPESSSGLRRRRGEDGNGSREVAARMGDR